MAVNCALLIGSYYYICTPIAQVMPSCIEIFKKNMDVTYNTGKKVHVYCAVFQTLYFYRKKMIVHTLYLLMVVYMYMNLNNSKQSLYNILLKMNIYTLYMCICMHKVCTLSYILFCIYVHVYLLLWNCHEDNAGVQCISRNLGHKCCFKGSPQPIKSTCTCKLFHYISSVWILFTLVPVHAESMYS